MDSTNGQCNMPKFRSNSLGKGANAWSLRLANFKFILASQQWATILLTILFAVLPLMVVHWLPSARLRHRPAYIYDATISYPMAAHDTVPAWASYTVPLILLIISVVVGELFISRTTHRNITNALASTVHFIVDAIAAFFVAVLVQGATKAAVGRLRPDFLDRCKPAALLANDYTFHLEIGSHTNPGCTETDEALLDDGRSSFPSGHSNMSAVVCTYTAGYLLWTVYMRHRHSAFGNSEEKRGWAQFLRNDLCHALALYWILLTLGVSWAIAGSRVVDNRHHPSDVVAGLLLGASVAIIFLLRSIPGARCLPRYDAQTEEVQYLRRGEGDGIRSSSRAPGVPEELAELGQHYPGHSPDYQVEKKGRSGVSQEMAEQGQRYSSHLDGYQSGTKGESSGERAEIRGHYPSHSSSYPASMLSNAVHPQPRLANPGGTAAPFGVQHSIPL